MSQSKKDNLSNFALIERKFYLFERNASPLDKTDKLVHVCAIVEKTQISLDSLV